MALLSLLAQMSARFKLKLAPTLSAAFPAVWARVAPAIAATRRPAVRRGAGAGGGAGAGAAAGGGSSVGGPSKEELRESAELHMQFLAFMHTMALQVRAVFCCRRQRLRPA